MSDDTPTQKFDAAAGDTATEMLSEHSGAAPAAGVRLSKRLVIILASVGGALVLALLVLVIVLLTTGSGQPTPVPGPTDTASPSPTPTPTATSTKTPSPTPTKSPSPTPTPEPTPAPEPPSTAAKITKFDGTDVIYCDSDTPSILGSELSFKWATKNAARIYFGVATTDASEEPLFNNLPPSGTSFYDFPDQVEFPCPQLTQTYTLTVIGTAGDRVSKTITVENEGDTE